MRPDGENGATSRRDAAAAALSSSQPLVRTGPPQDRLEAAALVSAADTLQ